MHKRPHEYQGTGKDLRVNIDRLSLQMDILSKKFELKILDFINFCEVRLTLIKRGVYGFIVCT